MKETTSDCKPDYFEEIPSESGDNGDTWYATSVLEFIISSYRYSCPELYSACWKAYRYYCESQGVSIGELSPGLGVFFGGWRMWFIGKYMREPAVMCEKLICQLLSGTIKQELDFWHGFSLMSHNNPRR